MYKSLILLSFIVVLLLFCYSSFAQQPEKVDFILPEHYKRISMGKLSTGHDVVEASINGQTGLFIVDTGAITIINNRLIDKYQLSKSNKIKTQQAAGVGGLLEIDTYPINQLILGGIQVPIQQIGATDLNAVTLGLLNATGQMIDGLIGQDVLMAMNAVIDVTDQLLYLQKGVLNHKLDKPFYNQQESKQQSLSLLTQLPLNSLHFAAFGFQFLTTEVTINGIKGRMIIDSGASRTMLSSSQLAKFELTKVQPNDVQNSSGAGGTFSLQNISIPAIGLQDFISKQTQIYHTDLSPLLAFIVEHTGVEVDGVVGQDVLLKQQALIDVGGQMLYLNE